jgi:flagellar brake protein
VSASAVGPVSEPIHIGVDLGPYVVNDAQQIAAELQVLVNSGVTVTLYPAPEAPFILGHVVAVDAQAGSFVFEPVGEPTVPAGELLFVATMLGVKLQFSCTWGGEAKPVVRLRTDLPASLIKLQRRRFARLEAPLGLPFSAEFSIGGRQYTLSLDDLGLGGVGLRAAPREASLLYVGRRLPKVRLLLGHDEELMVNLDVRSRRAWHTYLLGEQFLIGCRFIDLKTADEEILHQALAQLKTNA